ncbi:MAG: 50S ribosomal protein L3 [Campylobacterota bacterium]
MEFLVEKIGMSRTVAVPSVPVTLLKLKDVKVCEVTENGKAIVAYQSGKKTNKAIQGQQKKYNLDKHFNAFKTMEVANEEAGDLDTAKLEEATMLKTSFTSKGRGYTGVMKRYNFGGGPKTHGSRFHRRVGSIGMAEMPGKVQPGQKMPGHYGNETVTVKNEVMSYDAENGVIAVRGSIPGANGATGVVKVVK